MLEALGDLVGEDVLAEFCVETGLVVCLDDALDGAADGVQENAVEFHRVLPHAWVSKMLNAR